MGDDAAPRCPWKFIQTLLGSGPAPDAEQIVLHCEILNLQADERYDEAAGPSGHTAES